MSEEKGFKGTEPDEVKSLPGESEGDEVEGHVKSVPGGKQINRSEDSDDADVEGHFKPTP